MCLGQGAHTGTKSPRRQYLTHLQAAGSVKYLARMHVRVNRWNSRPYVRTTSIHEFSHCLPVGLRQRKEHVCQYFNEQDAIFPLVPTGMFLLSRSCFSGERNSQDDCFSSWFSYQRSLQIISTNVDSSEVELLTTSSRMVDDSNVANDVVKTSGGEIARDLFVFHEPKVH